MGGSRRERKKRKADTSGTDNTINSPLLDSPSAVNMEHIIEKLDIIDRKIDDTKTILSTKIENEVDRLRSDIFDLQKKNDMLTSKLEETEKFCFVLKEEANSLRVLIDSEREKRNDLDQYGRREMVRFVGVGPDNKKEQAHESENKVLRVINCQLGLSHIHSEDISVAHRVGQFNEGRERQVIVKFMSRRHRSEVIAARRKLKGTGIAVLEDLTPLNAERLGVVHKHRSVANSWTTEGRIFALLSTGEVVRVVQGDMTALDRAPPCPPRNHPRDARDAGCSPGPTMRRGESSRKDANGRQASHPMQTHSPYRFGQRGPWAATPPSSRQPDAGNVGPGAAAKPREPSTADPLGTPKTSTPHLRGKESDSPTPLHQDSSTSRPGSPNTSENGEMETVTTPL